ncbi:murein hydrolase activator EnvC [Croceicoccus sp. Ery15]|uniref:murein hydrolase activator EnvC family protein n=1 Tax=Croceicoccus sp. Ery15 TaxID=1703338 RepID=UPI001E2AC8B1|nr:peptidoglycan DD-metalloendopeptidase family protein [Croceicoccus sp. Ery15]
MRRAVLLASVPVAVLALLVPAAAQIADNTISADSLAEAQQARIAAQNRARILAERAARIQDDALKAEAEAEALSAQIAASRARIEEARQQETMAADRLGFLREGFARQRAPLSRMMAALQRLALRPMILLVLRPSSVRDYVRTRAMVAAITPQIAQQTRNIRADLTEMRTLAERSAAARAAREDASRELADRRAELRASGAEGRLAARSLQAAAGEARREATLRGVEADSIAALAATQTRNRQTEARLAALLGPVLPAGRPAASVPAIRPRLPVAGSVVAGYGERDAAGGRARGLTIAASPGAPIVAPLAGEIAFAREWRGYGTLVMIRHKGGYLSLVAGLTDAQVKEGQIVKQGDALGRAPRRAPQGNPRILYELRRSGRPVHPLLAV